MKLSKSITCIVIAAMSMDVAEGKLRRLRKVHHVEGENQTGDATKKDQFFLSSFDRLVRDSDRKELVPAADTAGKVDSVLEGTLDRELQDMSMGSRRLNADLVERELQMSMGSRRLGQEMIDEVVGRELQMSMGSRRLGKEMIDEVVGRELQMSMGSRRLDKDMIDEVVDRELQMSMGSRRLNKEYDEFLGRELQGSM